ncbi:metalloregulator ArsR/SmtB family transcription factor [Paraflavitalea sp. CAU 1676]|uniref:ArsR/SmtB family transcription factor n=1 Tax=Paraflavitalea sp. CAU 1676 TaxID=3032598 RepID=UPI0023DA301A|nr:metalloregulator ArsR/SmtB family transcription factor [Paraflavitalea sp. CAU 1676]MDF2188583.1 metalloregulator ArsR/SmtB family transcription factor [Paraflavitalea sp. CAU 1676]
MRRDVFQAIADPTRRQIIGLLSRQTLTLNGVAEHFAVSRPAISKHMKILSQCGLVTIKQRGRERYCEAILFKLQEVTDWAEQYNASWTTRLDALQGVLETEEEAVT